MVIAGTGHRPQKLGKEWDGRGPISDALFAWCILMLKQYKPEYVVVGGALGFDMILAEAALSLSIPVKLFVPFKGQESKWFKSSKERYYKIYNHPLTTVYIVCEGGYAPWKMQKRNEAMVDQLTEEEDRLLACWDGSSGGTKNCVDYAIGQGKENQIERINPKHIV